MPRSSARRSSGFESVDTIRSSTASDPTWIWRRFALCFSMEKHSFLIARRRYRSSASSRALPRDRSRDVNTSSHHGGRTAVKSRIWTSQPIQSLRIARRVGTPSALSVPVLPRAFTASAITESSAPPTLDLRTTSTPLAHNSRAVRGVDVRVCWVDQTIGVAQPGPDVERVAIRILLEPERLVESVGGLAHASTGQKYSPPMSFKSPSLGLVIENFWSSWIYDSIDPGRIHEHDSQLGCPCIFFKTALLKSDPSVPLQPIDIVVERGRASKCSPQIIEIRAKRQLGCGGLVLDAAVPHSGATHEP